jgi:UDP-glucose 4-epimerase
VTGAAGFVGSHLVEHLIREQWEVIALDRQRTKYRAGAAFPLQDVICDLEDPHSVGQLRLKADVVLHLAGYGEMLGALRDPAAYLQANVIGTAAALELARSAGARRFVYAASSSCYGANPPVPTNEDAPIDTGHPYALSKWMGEQAVFHWARVYGLEVNSLRLFTAYGPRMRKSDALGPVLNIFLAQKAHGVPLTIVGDGTQGRDFVHARDVATAFRLAAISKQHGKIWNVGSGETQTIEHIAALIGGPTVRMPERNGDPHTARADVTAIGRDLGWAPRVFFEAGLAELVGDQNAWRDAPVWLPDVMQRETAQWQALLEAR